MFSLSYPYSYYARLKIKSLCYKNNAFKLDVIHDHKVVHDTSTATFTFELVSPHAIITSRTRIGNNNKKKILH